MKVMVLGSGGREHALAWKLAQSPRVERVLCAPGNGGTARFATNLPDLPIDAPREIYRIAKKENVGLVVIGPEGPLCAGLADHLREGGLPVFGPSRRAARLEGSKVHAKQLMRLHTIPTAEFKVFSKSSEALSYLRNLEDRNEYPVAIKADGLAGGKGVTVAENLAEAKEAVRAILDDQVFGARQKLLIEEGLRGKEVSIHCLVGGDTLVVLEDAVDAKRLQDGDRGPNTGGMGAYSPSGLLDAKAWAVIEDRVLVPTVHATKRDDAAFTGALYVGLMLTPTGPRVLEFNVRFGDPEAQCLLPRLQSDLLPLLLGVATGDLASVPALEWDPRVSVTVVMAQAGYPGPTPSGRAISGLAGLEDLEDVFVFHAGTRKGAGGYVTDGGRVLAVTALADTREAARDRAYEVVRQIRFPGAVFRTDIAATDDTR